MSTEDANHEFEIKLLDNGIDFILKGIDELFNDEYELFGYTDALDVTPIGYKYGILHLFSGFLLLLKERLYRHMPELIFSGKIREVQQALNSKKAKIPKTVDLDEALERLEIGPRVVFSKDEIENIRKMQGLRNKFEHYEVSLNRFELWSAIKSFLALIDKFLVHELHINIEVSTEESVIVRKIYRIESVWKRIVEQRMEDWQTDTVQKLVEFQADRSSILDEIHRAYRREKGAFTIFITCPNCNDETLIVSGDYKGICSNEECESMYPITTCDRCTLPTTGFPWEFILCDDCQDWIRNSD